MDNFDLKKYLAENKLLKEGFQKPEEDSNIETLKKRYWNETPEDLETIASKQDSKVWTIGSPEFDADEIQLGDYIKFPTESQPTLVFKADEKSINADYDSAEYSKYNRSLLNKMNREASSDNSVNEVEKEINPITKKKFNNLLALAEKAVANKDTETLQKIYDKALVTGSKGWSYFIDSLYDRGLAHQDGAYLKWNLEESNINEAEGNDLYYTAGEMISQVGLFTKEKADKLEAEKSGNLYRFYDTPEEKAELIRISEGYKAYLAKVKAAMDALINDPMYQVAVGDVGGKYRDRGPGETLAKAYYRAQNI